MDTQKDEASKEIVPIVALGMYRHIAASTSPLFKHASTLHPASPKYNLVAILDLKSSSAPYVYTAHNLAITLRTLFPRPKVFIVGAFLDETLVEEAVRVWDEYIQEVNAGKGEVMVQDGDREAAEREEKSLESVDGEGGVGKGLVIDMVRDPPTDEDWQGYILEKLAAAFEK